MAKLYTLEKYLAVAALSVASTFGVMKYTVVDPILRSWAASQAQVRESQRMVQESQESARNAINAAMGCKNYLKECIQIMRDQGLERLVPMELNEIFPGRAPDLEVIPKQTESVRDL